MIGIRLTRAQSSNHARPRANRLGIWAAIWATALAAPSWAQGNDGLLDVDLDTPTATKTANEGEQIGPGGQAPTMRGLTGLFRVVSTDVGAPHTFRVGLHTELFSGSSFLVESDSDARFAGTLAASYTPMRFLEFFFNFRSQANSNERADPNRLDQEVILALGDFGLGGKLRYPLHEAFGIGANIGLDFFNSVGGVALDGDAIGFYIGALGSLDLDPLVGAPLRFHLNFGFQLDNSTNLASFGSYPLASLQVEKFALGIKPSRMQVKLGTDFSMRRWVGFGLTPMVELNFDIATGAADADFTDARFLKSNGGSLLPDEITGRATAWATVGVRVNPLAGLNLEIASDIGVQSPGYAFGPPVMPWNVILGFSYAYDPKPRVKVVTRERIRTVVKGTPKPPAGQLRGRIVDEKTMEPVDGAVVTFPGKDLTGLSSDPDGGFLSYEFPPGKVAVMVRHENYQPAKLMADIVANQQGKLEIKLTPAAPKVGKVDGRVIDLKGAAVSANIAVSGVETRQVTAAADGRFSLELKPGQYSLQISADGYLSKERALQVAPGATTALELALSPKPKRSLVRVTRRAIVIRRQVHFATGTATLLPDSRQLLDEVVHVLASNPQIKQLEIGGHTDNRGSVQTNMRLSQQRAEAVRGYLVENGVAPGRLAAKGYGPTQPKVPNLTARNRARNRRVEFKIVAQ